MTTNTSIDTLVNSTISSPNHVHSTPLYKRYMGRVYMLIPSEKAVLFTAICAAAFTNIYFILLKDPLSKECKEHENLYPTAFQYTQLAATYYFFKLGYNA